MKYAVGIDIGGTKISLVLGTEKGKILARHEIKTGVRAKTKACVKELASNLRTLILHSCVSPKKILGIGVGCPGPVDSSKGALPRSPNLPGWKGIPLRSILQKATGLPVFLANDANAAALGEQLLGAGKRTQDLIYITVSTGIGGGIVMNGELHEGAGCVAGEVGHMSVVPEGRRCGCGKRGCLEAYASGTAIVNDVRERMTSKNTVLWKFLRGNKRVGAKQVGRAACEGDKLAIESYRKAGYYLGIGIANLLNILNPQKVVIGGGVLKSAPKIFWKAMIKSAKQHAWPEAFRTVRIVPSQLKRHVGDHGALALVFRNQCGRP
ncbi:MAG: ROK family protein [Candidatus Omnitrophota bacterium]